MAIRNKLIKGDSTVCNLHLVSKYPIVDPKYIIRLALYLQDTKTFVKPIRSDMSEDGIEISQENDYEFVQFEEKCLRRNSTRKMSSSQDDSNHDLLGWHFERIQTTLKHVDEAIKTSDCDHELVHMSLKQVKQAVNALGNNLPRPSWSHSIRTHKRNTSIAVEALAFE